MGCPRLARSSCSQGRSPRPHLSPFGRSQGSPPHHCGWRRSGCVRCRTAGTPLPAPHAGYRARIWLRNFLQPCFFRKTPKFQSKYDMLGCSLVFHAQQKSLFSFFGGSNIKQGQPYHCAFYLDTSFRRKLLFLSALSLK